MTGKRELARVIAAIVLDADAKMDDPDTYDRVYVMEDLLGRIVQTIAPHTNEVFEAWQDHRLAYPEMLARDETGLVRPFVAYTQSKSDAETATALAADTEAAIRSVLRNRHHEALRETWLLQTWDGVRRHAFVASWSGMDCDATVERRGVRELCGLLATHLVHETEYKV